jgi:hypothetical protein
MEKDQAESPKAPADQSPALDYAKPLKSDCVFFIILGFVLSGTYWFLTLCSLDKPPMYVFFFPFADLAIWLHLPMEPWEGLGFLANIPLWGFGFAYVITLIRRRRDRDPM